MDERKPDNKLERRVEEAQLEKLAYDVQSRAYCRYSKFPVGCAVLLESGKTYVGCNVENVSYGLTICAERNAFCNIIANEPENCRRIAAVLIVGNDRCSVPLSPCGACRQFMAEFAPASGGDIPIFLVGSKYERVKRWLLKDLLPDAVCVKDVVLGDVQ